MLTIGLIGGMSWESSLLYYQAINRGIQSILGGVHSSKCIMVSVDFGEIAHLQHENNWAELTKMMGDAAENLEKAGADFIILCTNTMHKVSVGITDRVKIPFIHIADATAIEIMKNKHTKLGLLATRFSMEEDFLKRRYREYGIEVIIPEVDDRVEVHRIIYEELVKGIISPSSRVKFLEVIEKLIAQGAQGIISGCTEVELLISPSDIAVNLYETAKIHAAYAVDLSLGRVAIDNIVS
jgi:aspartate racemase